MPGGLISHRRCRRVMKAENAPGCSSAWFRAPDWGSGGRRFKSCHPDFCEAKIEQWRSRAGEQETRKRFRVRLSHCGLLFNCSTAPLRFRHGVHVRESSGPSKGRRFRRKDCLAHRALSPRLLLPGRPTQPCGIIHCDESCGGQRALYQTRPENFFTIAHGSVQECAPLVEVARRRGFVSDSDHSSLKSQLEEMAKMTSGLINGLARRDL